MAAANRPRQRGRLTVIPPGSRVGIKVPEIADAYVLEAIIGPGPAVSYEVAWWEGPERYTARLDAGEVEADPPARVTVGFHRPEC